MSLAPQSSISDLEREQGLKLLVIEAAFSSTGTALTSGAILTAFALHLGASNLWVGALASAPFLTQLLQLPGVLLVERLRARKRIAVISSIAGRLMLPIMAVTAFFQGTAPLLAFLLAQYVMCGLSAFGACAWNAWLRDLAPVERLGQVFARRTVWATAVTLVTALAAALILEQTAQGTAERSIAFAGMFVFGGVTGLLSARIVSRMPEPTMPPVAERLALSELLRPPLSDPNFRRLMIFVVSWQFAVNFATPFFTVFIVRRLGFDVSLVLLLSSVSQVANLVSLRSWGVLSDRYSNKSVLLVSAPAYILGIVAMVGASQSSNQGFVLSWLVALHVLMGAAVAGVTLASTNIALKLSPKGSATAYVAVNAMATAAAAGLAPIVGGLLADVFASRKLELLLRWTSPAGELMLPLAFSHWDFYFMLSGVLGLYAVHRLTLVAEEGEIERSAMVLQVVAYTRRAIRNSSTIAGLRAATTMPANLLRDARMRSRLLRAQRRKKANALARV